MISPDLHHRVLVRLGFDEAPRADLAGLGALYSAWSAAVPFDNVRKSVALHRGGSEALPGSDAAEFLESWLRHGTGGTCWAGSNALCMLARSLGFDARRSAGSMRDTGEPNHGTTTVSLDGMQWLVDSSMLTGVVLPIGRRELVQDPEHGVEIEWTEQGHVVWFDTPPHPELFPCRLLHDHVTHAYCLAAYERSRVSSPFNQGLYARRNRPGRKVVLRGATRFVRTPDGTTAESLSREALVDALEQDIGLSRDMIDAWTSCGALEACFATPMGPHTAPLALLPPSRRVNPSATRA